jgi:hypothetical protein
MIALAVACCFLFGCDGSGGDGPSIFPPVGSESAVATIGDSNTASFSFVARITTAEEGTTYYYNYLTPVSFEFEVTTWGNVSVDFEGEKEACVEVIIRATGFAEKECGNSVSIEVLN